jgi:hypothetical protein
MLMLSITLFSAGKAEARVILLSSFSLCDDESNYPAVYGSALVRKAFDLWAVSYESISYRENYSGLNLKRYSLIAYR